MKYIFLLLLLCAAGWLIYRQIKRKLRALRGEPEPVHTAPRGVKVLAAIIVFVYGVWFVFRLYNTG